MVRIRSTPLQSKIREIYKSSQENQAEEMMNGNYNGQHMNPYGLAYQNQLTQLMGLQNYGIQQQQIQQGRNPPAGYPGYPGPHHGGVPGGKKHTIFILKLSTLFNRF